MIARDPNHPIPAGNAMPEHLGDGAYVSHDGFQIWVSADRDGGLEAVALEALAIEQLVAYARRLGILR